MPAINPSRLQIQIEELLVYFNKPDAFHHRLRDLFSLYANRTLQFGQTPNPAPIFPKYHLPPPLIRQLQMAIKPHLEKDPKISLKCADQLWEDPYFEIKQFAIFILGNIPVEEPDPIIDRLASWIEAELDDALKSELLSIGTFSLQKDFPSTWEKFLQSLLDQGNPKMVSLGIQGLIEGVKTRKIENFPMVFRLISPIIKDPHTANMKALENLIEEMSKQSSTETVYFLKQTLSLSQSNETLRLIKRCLPLLPEKDRQDLKSTLS